MTATTLPKEDIVQQQILAAGQRLFQHHGYQKVTMDDVAKAVGKGRSSLYYYYSSKDELFHAVMDIELDKAIAEMKQAASAAAGLEEKLKAMFMARLITARKRKELYKALDEGMDAAEMSRYTRVKHEVHRRMMEKQTTLLIDLLSEAIAHGELPPAKADEQNQLALVLLSSVNGLKREMTISGNFSEAEKLVSRFTALVLKGMK